MPSRERCCVAGTLLFAAAGSLALNGCTARIRNLVATAPNHGREIDVAEDDDGAALVRAGVTRALRVAAGPPSVSLSVWVMDPPPASASRGGRKLDARGTLLVLHGWRREKRGMLRFGREFARAGFRVALVDLRGHGRSSGEWLTYGVLDARDLSQTLDALEGEGLLAKPIGVFGISYGAAAAIQLAALDTRIEAVIAVASFGSLEEVAREEVRLFVPFSDCFLSDEDIGSAVDGAGRLAGFDPSLASPLRAIVNLRTPLLLIHGECDRLIPARHSRALEAAASGRARLVLLPGLGHNAVFRDPDGAVSGQALAWLDSLGWRS